MMKLALKIVWICSVVSIFPAVQADLCNSPGLCSNGSPQTCRMCGPGKFSNGNIACDCNSCPPFYFCGISGCSTCSACATGYQASSDPGGTGKSICPIHLTTISEICYIRRLMIIFGTQRVHFVGTDRHPIQVGHV